MSPLPLAISRLRQGGMVILTDDEDRENEGDLVLCAAHVTAAAIAFMAKKASGLICLCLTCEHAAQLDLKPMAPENRARRSTAFTVSIEACEGITTGISAADRAHTIRVAADPKASPSQIVSPGHVFPLVARPGGLLERDGHTEGSIALMGLAGLPPSAVICEIMGDDGQMLRGQALKDFAELHDLPILAIDDIRAQLLASAA